MRNPLYPTLKQFWQQPARRSADLTEPGWSRLYCRKGPRFLALPGCEHGWIDNLLQLANLTARKPGSGTFKKLLGKIERELRCNIFVENVLNPRFAEGLVRLGFIQLDGPEPPCFLKMMETT